MGVKEGVTASLWGRRGKTPRTSGGARRMKARISGPDWELDPRPSSLELEVKMYADCPCKLSSRAAHQRSSFPLSQRWVLPVPSDPEEVDPQSFGEWGFTAQFLRQEGNANSSQKGSVQPCPAAPSH